MILFDESHNEFCTISGATKKRSYTNWKECIDTYGVEYVQSRKKFLNVLPEVRAVVFAEPHSYFTIKEVRALLDFVLSGKSLILIGNHHNLARYYSYGCNEVLNVIANPFGMRFNADEVRFKEKNIIHKFYDHVVCTGVEVVHYWRGCSVSLLRQNKRYTAKEIAEGSRYDQSEEYPKRPVMAAVYEKKGKIFCLGDSSVWSDPEEDLEDDNLLFAENVIQWAITG
ncbi:MAG: hypothetical protein PVF58_04825 [Candidatus Methanofastidiosia archaeon]|jgi:hypothetical protein